MPQSVLYDSDRCLIVKITANGDRQRTQRFTALRSHYVIRDRYGRPGKGNDKGKVEGVVACSHRNLMVPLPRFASWAEFNDYLEEQCLKRQADILRGHRIRIGERMQSDPAAMQDAPATPFEACDPRSGQITSTSVVRYRGNEYPVPVASGHLEVWIKGCRDRVVIGCAAEVIAEHVRSYDKDDITFDPVHYPRLIERKIMAFDQAVPLQDWDLPDACSTSQRLLETRQGKTGKREYVQALRLLEIYEHMVLHAAIKGALRMRAVSFDAIKHLVAVPRRPDDVTMHLHGSLPGNRLPSSETSSGCRCRNA